jgi:hydrogenase maturation protein HypF
LGDVENIETLDFFDEALTNLKSVYGIEPRALAHDLHPDYNTTRWAERQGLFRIPVQHHHAHVASCMAENRLDETVIGVALDGTGFGADSQMWGGEFLVSNYAGFERAAHFRYIPLIGGEQAIRQPWRVAAAHLIDAFGPGWRDLELPLWAAGTNKMWQTIERLYHLSGQYTSSCGRLFDAVSALAGCCDNNSYEGEAAMLLEAAADFGAQPERLPVQIDTTTSPWSIDTRPLIRSIADGIGSGRRAALISRDFHETVAHTITAVCVRLRDRTGLNTVCLSGGTFQNAVLLGRSVYLLAEAGFRVFSQARVPTNDGGIALGQVAILARHLSDRDNE